MTEERLTDPGRQRRSRRVTLAVAVVTATATIVLGGFIALAFKTGLSRSDSAARASAAAERAAADAKRATAAAAREGRERRDQTCLLFERQETREVNRVRRTYAYLARLPREERGSNLTREVVRGLPQQLEDARAARAPAYCNEPKDAPTVGLPEPGPTLPRARDHRHLLEP